MRALIQRVTSAGVAVEDTETRSIGHGLVVLLGVAPSDTERDAEWLANKILSLRLFPRSWPPDGKPGAAAPAEGKPSEFDLSVGEVGGDILAVSQFTLYADTRKGRRPDFTRAALPAPARRLYEHFVAALRKNHPRVATGEFGARMRVEIHNQGPVTILLDSAEGKAPGG